MTLARVLLLLYCSAADRHRSMHLLLGLYFRCTSIVSQNGSWSRNKPFTERWLRSFLVRNEAFVKGLEMARICR